VATKRTGKISKVRGKWYWIIYLRGQPHVRSGIGYTQRHSAMRSLQNFRLNYTPPVTVDYRT